jgi:DNA-binding Lrp family transcriptional regulator
MNTLLNLLEENALATPETLAAQLKLTPEEVRSQIKQLEDDRVILAYKALVDDERAGRTGVKAVIEVKITPERGGGFNRLAERLSRFEEVESCYLMSGAYDLLIFLNGPSLQKVASFVSEKLSTLEGVLSTSTHFMLRSYKEGGYLLETPPEPSDRLKVAP